MLFFRSFSRVTIYVSRNVGQPFGPSCRRALLLRHSYGPPKFSRAHRFPAACSVALFMMVHREIGETGAR